jgi:hypothetical protein
VWFPVPLLEVNLLKPVELYFGGEPLDLTGLEQSLPIVELSGSLCMSVAA